MSTGLNPYDEGPDFAKGDVVYVGPFTVENYLSGEEWWGLKRPEGENPILEYESGHMLVPGHRVLTDEAVAAIALLYGRVGTTNYAGNVLIERAMRAVAAVIGEQP